MGGGSLPHADILFWVISGQILAAGVQVLGGRACGFYDPVTCLSLVTFLVLYENGGSLVFLCLSLLCSLKVIGLFHFGGGREVRKCQRGLGSPRGGKGPDQSGFGAFGLVGGK